MGGSPRYMAFVWRNKDYLCCNIFDSGKIFLKKNLLLGIDRSFFIYLASLFFYIYYIYIYYQNQPKVAVNPHLKIKKFENMFISKINRINCFCLEWGGGAEQAPKTLKTYMKKNLFKKIFQDGVS